MRDPAPAARSAFCSVSRFAYDALLRGGAFGGQKTQPHRPVFEHVHRLLGLFALSLLVVPERKGYTIALKCLGNRHVAAYLLRKVECWMVSFLV